MGWSQNAQILAQQIVAFGANSGVFVYSGTPASGNPPIAWLSPASSDPYRNAITPQMGIRGALALLSFLTGDANETAASSIKTTTQGAGTAVQGVTDFATADFGSGKADLFLVSASHDGTVGASIQANVGGAEMGEFNALGAGGLFMPFGRLLQAADPGGAAGVTAWKNLTPANGWTQRSGNMQFQYQFLPWSATGVGGYGATWLKGVLVPGTKTDQTVIGTLPNGFYNPVENVQIAMSTTGALGTTAPFVQIDSANGNITVNGVNVAGLTNILFNGFIPLGSPS